MLNVIDTATTQRYLNFAAPIAEGYDRIYVKMGGDNVDPTYEAPHYDDQVDKARFHGYKNIGHYWVPNADPSDADDIDTPEQQADYMIDRLRNWNPKTDFIVLDNESLDGAIRFNDAQTAAFVRRVQSRLNIPAGAMVAGISQILVYSGLSDARGTQWPEVLATGTNFIIAAYSYPPFGWAPFASIPADRIVGHQTGGRTFATIPGSPSPTVAVDINSFKDNAFNWPTEEPTGDGSMTPDQANMLQQVFNAVFFGGGSMEDDGQSISRSLAQIQDRLAALEARSSGASVEEIIAAIKELNYRVQ